MNIEKKYFFVAPINALAGNTSKRKELARAASDREMSAMTPSNAREYQARTGNNPYDGLSDYERRQAEQKLDDQKGMLYPKILGAFKADWQAVRSEYRLLRREQAGAADRSSRSWQYDRLAYELTRAREFLQTATLDQIQKKYSAFEVAGDRHRLRALAEAGLEVLGTRPWTDKEVIKSEDLRGELRRMLDQLVTTQEESALMAQSSILSGKIADLADATTAAAAEFFTSDALGTDDSPFVGMMKGVRVSRRVDPEDLNTITSVDLDGWDDPDQAAPAPAVVTGYVTA